MAKTILITGANAGLGREVARQLALQNETEKIFLACRNKDKANAAMQWLENETKKSVFEVLVLDVTDLTSVRSVVATLPSPLDALVMNAGGVGGKAPMAKTKNGVTQIAAVNLLGHAVLLEELLKANKLSGVAMYAGSEVARGVARLGMKPPKFVDSSVEEFASILDGSFFDAKTDPMVIYGYVKYIAALWMSSVARKNDRVRFVTVSPGGTKGTNGPSDAPPFIRWLMTSFIGTNAMRLMGLMHNLDVGAKRYVDVINDPSFKSGHFYASEKPIITGRLIDQGAINKDFYNRQFQENASLALQRYTA